MDAHDEVKVRRDAGDVDGLVQLAGYRRRRGSWRRSRKPAAAAVREQSVAALATVARKHPDDLVGLFGTIATDDEDAAVRAAGAAGLASLSSGLRRWGYPLDAASARARKAQQRIEEELDDRRSRSRTRSPSRDRLATTRMESRLADEATEGTEAVLVRCLDDPDPRVRAAAAAGFGAERISVDGPGRARLVAAVEDPDAEVRWAAADGARRAPAAEAVPHLEASGTPAAALALAGWAEYTTEEPLHTAATDALRSIAVAHPHRYLEAIDRLRAAEGDPSWPRARRQVLTEEIADRRCSTIAPLLADRLADHRDPLLAALADTLGAIGDPGSSPALVGLLTEAPGDDVADGAKPNAWRALVTIGADLSTDQLVDALAALPSGADELGAEVEVALRARGTDAVAPLVLAARDPACWARKRAITLLGELGDDAAAGALIELVLHDGLSWVREAAIDALAALDVTLPADGLVAALAQGPLDQDHRRELQGALAGLGDAAVDPVLGLACDGAADPDARRAALGVLARLGDTRAVDLLAPIARDADSPVQVSAVEVLGALGGPTAAEVLVELSAEEHPSDAGRAAADALGPDVDARTPTRARLAAWAAAGQGEALCSWIERTADAPGAAGDDLDFVRRRLAWLPTNEAVPVAGALIRGGVAADQPPIPELIALARKMATTEDHEETEWVLGDQTLEKEVEVVSEARTRAEGRRYLELLGVEPGDA